jgi:hypothetical protein
MTDPKRRCILAEEYQDADYECPGTCIECWEFQEIQELPEEEEA